MYYMECINSIDNILLEKMYEHYRLFTGIAENLFLMHYVYQKYLNISFHCKKMKFLEKKKYSDSVTKCFSMYA